MTRKRKKYGSTFKARVALEAIRNEQSLVELSRRFEVDQEMITKWRQQLAEQAGDIFESDNKRKEGRSIQEFHAMMEEVGKKWRLLI